MILDDTEVMERFESPMNLLNRLKSSLSNHSSGSFSSNHSQSHHSRIVSIPPTASDLIDDLEDKLANRSLKAKASAIMSSCMDELKGKISEIKPERLATVVAEMNKVVTAQANSKEQSEKPQLHIYAPSFVSEEHFETIYVKE